MESASGILVSSFIEAELLPSGGDCVSPTSDALSEAFALWMCSQGVPLLPRKLPKAVELRAEAKVILNRWQQAMARSEADIAKSIELGDTILEDALHHESELQAYDFEVQLAMLDNRLIKPSNPPPELRPEHLEALRHFRSNSEA